VLTVLLTRGACPRACKDELAQCRLELMQSKVELASTSQSLEEERQAREAVEAELAATREKLLQAQLLIQTSSCFHQHFISRDSPTSARSASPRDSPGHVASALEVASDASEMTSRHRCLTRARKAASQTIFGPACSKRPPGLQASSHRRSSTHARTHTSNATHTHVFPR
jgi:hypothetical protein